MILFLASGIKEVFVTEKYIASFMIALIVFKAYARCGKSPLSSRLGDYGVLRGNASSHILRRNCGKIVHNKIQSIIKLRP